jgi:hypothetical protein
MKTHDELMKDLAVKTETTFDAPGEDRLHYDFEQIIVFAADMSREEYDLMEQELLDFEIKRKHYAIHAWNDSSGYDYWSKDPHESNYIQITARIDNPAKVKPAQLKRDLERAVCKFVTYHNIESHDFTGYGT